MDTNGNSNSTIDADTPHVDLQIVGAGLAGLLAANLASDAGLTVRLIERTAAPGGRASSADHHGYTLNVGPHALYLQGELRQTLIELGLDPAGSAPETAGGTGAIGNRIGLLPLGPSTLARTRLLPAATKYDLARLMARIPRIDPTELGSTTVDDWVRSFSTRREATAMVTGIVNLTTYNAASDLASADAVAVQLQMALDQSVRYVDNGWRSIVAWLSDRAERLGVQRIEATVRRVTTTPAMTTATTGDGVGLTARSCVIATGGPAVADRLLGLDGHHVEAAGPAVEASVLDLGLRRRPPVATHLGLDTRLYATLHSVAAGLAPTGRHLVSLARYRLPGDTTDPDETRRQLEDHAAQMGIDPGQIEMDRYLHRLVVANGMPLADRGGLTGRPPVAVADRPGVFVAGDWVGARGLLADGSAASAGDAVRAAVERSATEAPRSASSDPRARLVGR